MCVYGRDKLSENKENKLRCFSFVKLNYAITHFVICIITTKVVYNFCPYKALFCML